MILASGRNQRMDNEIREPAPALFATWFQPTHGSIGPEPVNSLDNLRRLVAKIPGGGPSYVVLAPVLGGRGGVNLHRAGNPASGCPLVNPPGPLSFYPRPPGRGAG